MTQLERLNYLISYLLAEQARYSDIEIPRNTSDKKRLLRSLMNVRPPRKVSAEFLKIQDEYLREETRQKGITNARDLTPVRGKLCLWQGDITTLKCGAIVNAANSAMLGCFVPCHGCIDNAIHTYAGVELRAECAEQMRGGSEPTGSARVTMAYNLPCDYVIHTVGPIVGGRLTDTDCELLADCYKSCLKAADDNNIKSIAFCCISTGEFHFPNERAAEIAIDTVEEYLPKSKIERVIFNVFKDSDLEIYKRLLASRL
ncbi:MAG: protein-ADP-ribose hydrolase [Oscillospiraceae bacterium]|nr:protein-ADP-ribose hydrolase [Oscillospiraceae bacterium]